MSHKTIKSTERTAVSRASTMRQALSEVVGNNGWLWVTFESGKSEKPIEVAVENGQFILNIPHQEKAGLLPKLQNVGVTMPAWWKVRKDKTKGLLTRGFLEIEASAQDQDRIVAFVDRVGHEVFAWKDDESLFACLQN